MKKIILLILLICLSACSNNINFETELKKAVEEEVALKAFSPDNSKTYFRYYTEPDVGNVYSDQTSNVFLYNDTKFIMNLNVSSIINNKYYNNEIVKDIQLNDEFKLFDFNGEYVDYKNNTYPYKVDVYKVNDTYYIKLNSQYVSFYANGNEINIINVSRKMIRIAKSINIYEDEVLANFSSKETIEYTKETIQLFDVIVPVNGKIQDIIENNDINNGSFGDDYEEGTDDNVDTIDDYQTDDYETN